MDPAGTAARSDTTALARQLRIAATRLEKLSSNAAEAVDTAPPRPSAVEPGKPPANEANNINVILRVTLRTLQRVEENLAEVHARLGNPFAERAAQADMTETG